MVSLGRMKASVSARGSVCVGILITNPGLVDATRDRTTRDIESPSRVVECSAKWLRTEEMWG